MPGLAFIPGKENPMQQFDHRDNLNIIQASAVQQKVIVMTASDYMAGAGRQGMVMRCY
jgi:hypothetical protein